MHKILMICMVLLAGCASLPQTLEPQNPEIKAFNYQQWQAFLSSEESAQRELNQEVLAGGVIASVTNLDNQSRIEVVNLPLYSSGKPDISKTPQGRFVAYIQGFIDSITYSKGKFITLAGLTSGIEKRKIGEFDYTFPVMQAHGHYLWTVQQHTYIDDPYLYNRMRQPCYFDGKHRRCPRHPMPYRQPIVHEYTELH